MVTGAIRKHNTLLLGDCQPRIFGGPLWASRARIAADRRTGNPSAILKATMALCIPRCQPALTCPLLNTRSCAGGKIAKIFERSLEQTADGPRWNFYEGPPTANGMPGVHHIEARVLKDAFPRFKTMQGFHVPAPGGLGLPRPAR